MDKWVTVPGRHRLHRVQFYALSYCGWCKKMKSLLNSLEIEYELLHIDEQPENEQNKLWETVEKFNPRGTVPTLVIDDGEDVVTEIDEGVVRRKILG
jgi:glutaredoxin